MGTFDAFAVGVLPPTFIDLQASITLVNQLNQVAPGRLIVGMFPTGTEGWETSFNEPFEQRLAPLGVRYDPTRAMTREQWLDSLRRIEAPTWGYVLEQLARKPTAAEVKASVGAFAQHAKAERKRVVLWLSAMTAIEISPRWVRPNFVGWVGKGNALAHLMQANCEQLIYIWLGFRRFWNTPAKTCEWHQTASGHG